MSSDTTTDHEMAPCPRCGKQIEIDEARCPNCGHRLKNSHVSPLLIIGLVIGIPILIGISGVLLLIAMCATGNW